MKLTGIELENAFNALQALQEEKFDIATGNTIAILSQEVAKQYRELYEKREAIIQEYADKDENGQVILSNKNIAHIPPETTEEAQEKLDEIYNETYTIEAKYLQVDKLGDIKLTLKQITGLKPLLDQ